MWNIWGTIKLHLSLNLLLFVTRKEVQDVRLSISHWAFSLFLLVHDLVLPVIFIDPGMLVLDRIYMLNPKGTSNRTAIAEVHIFGTKGTDNP